MKTLSWLDAALVEGERTRDRAIVKHAGPGNHPNGSSQQAHAGGGGGSRLDVEMSAADEAREILNREFIEAGAQGNLGARSRMKNAIATDLANHVAANVDLTDEERAFLIEGREGVINQALSRARDPNLSRWHEDAFIFQVLEEEGLGSRPDHWAATPTTMDPVRQQAMGLSDEGILRLALYGEADNFLRGWAQTALDHDEQARQVQVLADEMFPGEHKSFNDYVRLNTASDGSGLDIYNNDILGNFDTDIPPLERKLKSAFLDRTYTRTQELLADLPGTHVTLYRGFTSTNPNLAGWQPVSSNPLASWSTDESVARDFSVGFVGAGPYGYILEASVPKEWIVSTAMTGLGALHESEVIVNIPDGNEVNWTQGGYH